MRHILFCKREFSIIFESVTSTAPVSSRWSHTSAKLHKVLVFLRIVFLLLHIDMNFSVMQIVVVIWPPFPKVVGISIRIVCYLIHCITGLADEKVSDSEWPPKSSDLPGHNAPGFNQHPLRLVGFVLFHFSFDFGNGGCF